MSLRTRVAAALLAGAMALTPSLALGHDGIDRRTNSFRERNGRHELRTPSWLRHVARQRVRQLDDGGFYHRFDWLNGTPCRAGGENLAYRKPPPENPGLYFFRAWRESYSHRKVMLGRGWDAMASAVWLAPDGRMYAVQLFCDRG